MDKLKPCPFCGGKNLFVGTIAECEIQYETHPDYKNNSQLYTVCCDWTEGGCGASIGGSIHSKQEAIEAWNRRASDVSKNPT